MMNISPDTWKTTEVNVDSLWLISERDKSGKHANVYHGNFVPQVPRQLIQRYTKQDDVVLEFFMGSGTTLYECEQLGRRYIGFDINPQIIDYVRERMQGSTCPHLIYNTDVQASEAVERALSLGLPQLGKTYADLMIAHPPYLDIVKFTDLPYDLSQISDVNEFVTRTASALGNGLAFLKRGGYLGLVMGDIYRNSEVVPLAFYLMQAMKERYALKLKGTIIKNIEGNRGKLGAQNIWKYRALKSDYYLFKHEYIFVFKKEY